MNEDKGIPYIAYEGTQARLERMNRRVWILCIILIASLIITNACWIIYESQFTETEVTQDVLATDDSDAFVIGVGDYNGEGETDR